MKKIIIILSLIFIAGSSFGQLVSDARIQNTISSKSIGVIPVADPFSLIDFSKVRWSNSYSMSFFSGGNSSVSTGMLNSMMSYEISSKLSVALNVGLSHDPGMLLGNGSSNVNVLPGFQLDFHPSEYFNLRINYQQLDGRNLLYNNYLNRGRYIKP